MALDPEHQVAAGESDVEGQVAAGVSDPAEQPLCSDGASDQVRPEKGQESDSENKQSCGRCNSSMQPICRCFSEFQVMASSFKDSSIARYGREFFTAKNARRKFPIVNWITTYRLKHFIGDLVAGLTVGLTVIPQGLAYAQVAELPPQYGLYSAFMGVFVYTFLGTSKDITMGPTAIMSLLVAEFATERAPVKHDPTFAIILTFFTGFIQLAMGLLNMGFVVQFISFPVISGFTSAAAVIIAFGQIRKWLGLQNVSRTFISQFPQTFEKLGETNLWDFGMGLVCIIVLVLMKKVKEYADSRMKSATGGRKAVLKFLWLLCTARNAVVVVITAAIASIVYDVVGIKDSFSLTGEIQAGMPVPSVPKFSLEYFNETSNSTVTMGLGEISGKIAEGFVVVTLIGMLESVAIAKAFARRNEYKIDPSQELIAMGVANAISSFFHSYPVTGSFSRTAINSQSGVRTPAGGIWTGALVIVAIVVLTPYFFYIPEAALAAVIIAAVVQMVEYEIVLTLWRVKKLDLLPLLTTFFVSIFVNIEVGIIAGIGISVVMVLIPMARPKLLVTYAKASKYLDNPTYANEEDAAVILEPAQGLNFPGVEYIKDKVMKHGVYETPPKAVVLNAVHFSNCDYTMVLGVTQLSEYFSKHDLKFAIACCPDEIKETLVAAKIKKLKFGATVEDALHKSFGQSSPPAAAAAASAAAPSAACNNIELELIPDTYKQDLPDSSMLDSSHIAPGSKS